MDHGGPAWALDLQKWLVYVPDLSAIPVYFAMFMRSEPVSDMRSTGGMFLFGSGDPSGHNPPSSLSVLYLLKIQVL